MWSVEEGLADETSLEDVDGLVLLAVVPLGLDLVPLDAVLDLCAHWEGLREGYEGQIFKSLYDYRM